MANTQTETKTIEIEGIEISFFVGTGIVRKMSDWGKWVELKQKGYFTTNGYRHMYGHTDIIVKHEYR